MLKNINNIAFKIIRNNVLKIFSYQNRMQCKKFLKEKHPIWNKSQDKKCKFAKK